MQDSVCETLGFNRRRHWRRSAEEVMLPIPSGGRIGHDIWFLLRTQNQPSCPRVSAVLEAELTDAVSRIASLFFLACYASIKMNSCNQEEIDVTLKVTMVAKQMKTVIYTQYTFPLRSKY